MFAVLGVFHRPLKGDPKRGIEARDHLSVTFESHKVNILVGLMFLGSPFGRMVRIREPSQASSLLPPSSLSSCRGRGFGRFAPF